MQRLRVHLLPSPTPTPVHGDRGRMSPATHPLRRCTSIEASTFLSLSLFAYILSITDLPQCFAAALYSLGELNSLLCLVGCEMLCVVSLIHLSSSISFFLYPWAHSNTHTHVFVQSHAQQAATAPPQVLPSSLQTRASHSPTSLSSPLTCHVPHSRRSTPAGLRARHRRLCGCRDADANHLYTAHLHCECALLHQVLVGGLHHHVPCLPSHCVGAVRGGAVSLPGGGPASPAQRNRGESPCRGGQQ